MAINQALLNKIQMFLDNTLVVKTKSAPSKTTKLNIEVENIKILNNATKDDETKVKINEFIKRHKIKGFRDLLFKFIDDQNKKDAEVYKKALLDRRLFSKIRSDEDYHPNKKTVIALGLALKLDLTQTLNLLKAAGYALSESSAFDLIIVYCINHKIFEIDEINEILDKFKLNPLGQIS